MGICCISRTNVRTWPLIVLTNLSLQVCSYGAPVVLYTIYTTYIPLTTNSYPGTCRDSEISSYRVLAIHIASNIDQYYIYTI